MSGIFLDIIFRQDESSNITEFKNENVLTSLNYN